MFEVRNLQKVYADKKAEPVAALKGVSIEFGDRGMVFILGKSGCGKSTLLHLMGGLDAPTEGEFILDGKSSRNFTKTDFDDYRNNYIGFIFQEYNLLPEFSIRENIALALRLQGKTVEKERIDDMLRLVDLDIADRRPNQLSGGQKQRVAIARALIKNPRIIFADEPTGALDSQTGQDILNLLKKLSANCLVIVVSHDEEFARAYGDRIIELSDGLVVRDSLCEAD